MAPPDLRFTMITLWKEGTGDYKQRKRGDEFGDQGVIQAGDNND